MTDATATETQTEATTEPSKLNYEEIFGATYAPMFKDVIPQIQSVASTHNELVAQLNVKEGEISEEALEIARLRNKHNNREVTKLNNNIEKAQAMLEELKAKAYELVQDDVPQPLKEEEKAAVKSRVSDLRKEFQKQMDAVNGVASMLGLTDNLAKVKLPEINANGKRVGSGSGRGGYSGPRVRFETVYINGEPAQVVKDNEDGTKKITSNFTTAANELTKLTKADPRISSTDLQPLYFDAAKVQPDANGKIDSSALPKEVEFTYTYTNPNDKSTKEFVIKAVREG
jgi:hypothetical protein